MPTATETVRNEWTRLSSGWEAQRGYLREITQPVHAWLVERLQPMAGEKVLELGAGPGDTGFVAAPFLGKTGKLVSTDLSPEMVEVARRRAREMQVENVEFAAADAQALTYADASFDGVICRWGYMLMPDPAAAMKETRRVLKPKGRLVLSVFTPPADNPWAAIPSKLLVEKGHVPAPTPGTPGIMALGDRAKLESLLNGAGFTDLTVEALNFGWTFPDLAAYWTFLLEVTALGPAFQRVPEADREALRGDLAERLKPFTKGAALDLPARTWMVLAK